ncbi:MAG TPA: PD-(D/E)XK nuclease family protein [Nodularia sp. (in: cyanobacteria)]|nr:PD-(D/E)XK nuclease family protein [Nodularia sp. (in: cyanobacteria)]
MPPTERGLLENFVDNEELENLESKLAGFNIFEAIGVVRQELKHSNFLAFLLNPFENHRLNDIFLKRFLKLVLLEEYEPRDIQYTKISPVDIDIADLTDVEIRREWQNIDILIYSPQNKIVCAIENKVDAGEYIGNLERYRKIIEQEYKDCQVILIYLTPEGISPSDENWRIYSYSKLVKIIDNICTGYKSILGTDIYTLLTHYSTLLRRHIVSDSEVAELCRKIYFKHKQALDLIFEHRPDLQAEMATKIYEIVSQYSDSKQIFVELSSKKSVDFAFTQWRDLKLPLYFYFENNPVSLVIKVQIGLAEDEHKYKRKNIYELSKHNIPPFKPNRWTEKWTTIYKKQILTSKDYEDSDVEELIIKVQSFWDTFLEKDFATIYRVINDNIDKIMCEDIS